MFVQTLAEMKAVVARSPETLLKDALGAAALLVMLMVGLHLPGLV